MTNEKAIKHLEVIKGDCALVGDVHALDMAISALKEPTWQEKLEKEYLFESIKEDMTKLKVENERLLEKVETLKGEWIYDKGIENWRCSKCGQTPPPTGYVGNADFMATHFKFCNHCGADMREPKDILHEAIDNTTFAEEAYPNIKEELHKAVDMAEK